MLRTVKKEKGPCADLRVPRCAAAKKKEKKIKRKKRKRRRLWKVTENGTQGLPVSFTRERRRDILRRVSPLFPRASFYFSARKGKHFCTQSEHVGSAGVVGSAEV